MISNIPPAKMSGTTIQNHQTSPFHRPSQVFNAIRFVLLGFDPIKKAQVSRKLVSGGGVNAGQYGPDCTHVIVDKLVYDDPLCVSTRRDGKILVSSLWVDHSFDVGAPVDTSSVMYRPARDLNGIPGAKSLVICLTGYQREDREGIMTMVALMGAQFSKPLIASKVTHLICYKFEGEKYLLAKKLKKIKLINHLWVEDCLKAWEIVPEADYSKSGYELEMEAEAKDSEEEPEGVTARQNEKKIASPPHSLLSKLPKTVSNTSASKVFANAQEMVSVAMKTTSYLCEKIVSSSSTLPLNEANVISPTRTPSTTIDIKSNTSSAKRLNINLSDAFNMSSSVVQKVNIGTPDNGPAFCPNNEQNDLFSGNICGRKSLSSKGKNVFCDVHISKTSTPRTEDLDAVQRPQKKYKETSLVENVIQAPSIVSSISKKPSSPNLTKNNTVSKKGSTFYNTSVPRDHNEIDLEVTKGLQAENMSCKRSLCMDDATEPPEDTNEANKGKHADDEPETVAGVVMEEKSEGDLHDIDQHKDENVVRKKKETKRNKRAPSKTKVSVKVEVTVTDVSKDEPMWFIFTGHKLQRREFQQIIRRLKGRVCKVSHQWSYQATHFIVPGPIKRTEKFFAAAASGRWILKSDYLSASKQAGRFLAEEPYECHKNGLSEDGTINLEAPRKWRLLKEKTGHGAFYGMRIIIYGECIAPTLDTLKRAVKAGDGSILATSPPYTRFLNTSIDFAIVSPEMPRVDIWVQEFLKHEIPCVYADYLVEYVCKPGYPLERHVQYDTNVWAERSYNKLKKRLEEEVCEPITLDSDGVACEVCGSRDRGDEMLICGDESGVIGCGVGTHIDCCDPPLEDVPEEDWFCVKCSKKPKSKKK